MSYTGVYGAFKDGDMKTLGECRNSHRGAMWIWMELAKKHLKMKDRDYAARGDLLQDMSPVWKLASTDKLDDTEWFALMSTFDGVLVPRELMPKVADALRNFEPGTENLVKQSDLIREAFEKGARAIGWMQTSVCSCPWTVHVSGEEMAIELLKSSIGKTLTEEVFNEVVEIFDTGGDYRPYNIDDDKHRNLNDMRKQAWWLEGRNADLAD